MTFRRFFRVSAAVLGTVIVTYFTLGNFYAYKVSQREETRHDRAVANAEPQGVDEWLALRNDQPVVEWVYRNANGQTYVVRVYEDGDYISSVYRSLRSGQPARFVEGRLSQGDWRRLMAAGDVLYDRRQELVELNNEESANVHLLFASPGNDQRITYRYSTGDYDRLPEPYRDFDAQLFKAMQSWDVRPHHGYAGTHAAVNYGPEELPNLLRGLESDRKDLYESVAERMVAIGDSSLPSLIGVLQRGADTGYVPSGRYAAVLDAIAALDDVTGEGFALIKGLAETPARLPRRRELRKQAQAIVDRLEVDAYLDASWAISAEVEQRFRHAVLSPAEIEALRAEFARTNHRADEQRRAAKAALIDMGPAILPAVFERLRHERYERNRYNAELLDVLVILGGPDACLFAIRQEILDGSACIEPLRKRGAPGLPGLLKLLESEQRFARVKATDSLRTPEFAAFEPEYVALLAGKLDAYQRASSHAVRALQADAATSLIEILQAHAAADRSAVEVLLQAAVDPQQSEAARIAALKALAALGPAAAVGQDDLQALVGYESGRVYNELLATLESIGAR